MRGNQSTNTNKDTSLDETSKSVVFAQTEVVEQNVLAKTELWRRDAKDSDLWHGEKGLILNTAALQERKAYYNVVIERD